MDFDVELEHGMVVLDAVLEVQRNQAPDLAVRWNCKAAKCGSCSAEINGRPRLMCKTRIDHLPADQPITIEPMRAFPVIRDLVTDVSWNYEVNKRIPPFTPRDGLPEGDFLIAQEDTDRMSEFRKCIECFMCQDVCHVLRDHGLENRYFGPRFMIRLASLDMHPLDGIDRLDLIADEAGIGLCNITKCCTEVCPEGIHITDNAIIPLKERSSTGARPALQALPARADKTRRPLGSRRAPERRRPLRPLADRAVAPRELPHGPVAWLFARSQGERFLLRIEDLDRQRRANGGRPSRSPTCSRSASIGTNHRSGSPSACRSMTTRSLASATQDTSIPASVRAPRSARRPPRRTVTFRRAPTPGPVAS